MTAPWKRLLPNEVQAARPSATPADVLERAREIVQDVRRNGFEALTRWSIELGDSEAEPRLLDRAELEVAARGVSPELLALLERTARRIEVFASMQRNSVTECSLPLQGGHARQLIAPMERAGCYAPGGRYPLVSSALMTAVTARVAGVRNVLVASPRPSAEMLAAAHVAGADRFLCAGGAQAVAALAYGVEGIEPVDIVVGPGNRFVTAAKQLVANDIAIDMPAGPSELVVLADDSADPRSVAADLLAQAEHDPNARAFLVTPSEGLASRVESELTEQLRTLPTAQVARRALEASGAILTRDLDQACRVCNELAPEHLELVLAAPMNVVPLLEHYGALFIGSAGAEVFGDYGIGPNHVLPTGGGARRSGGLSVFDFLRIRTTLELSTVDPQVVEDTQALALLEGLHGHAYAASLRGGGS